MTRSPIPLLKYSLMETPLLTITKTLSRFQNISFPLVQEAVIEPVDEEDNTLHMDSVLRKRRLKMKKHKLRKRRREQRALKKRLGK